jgi:ATP-dependent protease HslVU (ClpYQ) peptidase subunit
MTLIAAWRTPAGIVIHADSQETMGDYRCEVNKVKAETMGLFKVLIAGAGSPGELLDSFSIRLRRRINDSVSTIEQFAAFTEKELALFHKKEFALCPVADKNVSYLIAASHPETRRYEAWTSSSVYIDPIPSDVPILMGWEWRLYVSIARKPSSRAFIFSP